MPTDEIDETLLLVEDYASRHRAGCTVEQLTPKYARNRLVNHKIELSESEKAELDLALSPNRPGFIELIGEIIRGSGQGQG